MDVLGTLNLHGSHPFVTAGSVFLSDSDVQNLQCNKVMYHLLSKTSQKETALTREPFSSGKERLAVFHSSLLVSGAMIGNEAPQKFQDV